jgi:transposase
LPGAFRLLVQRLLDHLKELDRQVEELEAQIVAWHRQSDFSRKLGQIPGIGPITPAHWWHRWGMQRTSKDGRQVAAWLGLVPTQHSSGGKQNLLGISKRGDTYLRTLLIHGARSVIYHAQKKDQHLRAAQLDQWCGAAAQQECGGGGAGQQECPHRVGVAGA